MPPRPWRAAAMQAAKHALHLFWFVVQQQRIERLGV
jgi:hypothetical protein